MAESSTAWMQDLTSFLTILKYLQHDQEIDYVVEVIDPTLQLHQLGDLALEQPVKQSEDLATFQTWYREKRIRLMLEEDLYMVSHMACDCIRLPPFYFVKSRGIPYK